MSQPRIVEDIVNAYRETGRRPVVGHWFGEHREVCPMCAYALCYGGIKGRVTHKKVEEYVRNKLGFDYVRGFVTGWDDDASVPITEDEIRGKRHAKLVRNRLKKEGYSV